MNSSTLYIHEFSTGIQAEKTTDGGWVSQGFTGQYMNRTIDSIPRAVQEAISNRNFSVAEGASGDKPAFVGREVAGYGEEWSVVAVVTRGRDDRGRSASMYRYFLSEGLGNLGKILSWLNAKKQAGQNIIFDPFDTQILGQPHEYSDSEPNLSLRPELESLLQSSPPIIIPSDFPCAPLLVNKMAQAISDGQLIAWGYNIEALEEPRAFWVIQPASSRAEEILRKAIASKPNTPAPIAGERGIISAINGLVKRDRVKPEQVETIENALANPQIDLSYWESIFKGRGTDKAIKQGIYSADMVRLLTLRAMIVPETLPEFLAWISKEGKQQESKEVSDKFQAEIKKSLSQVPEQGVNLVGRIYQGVVLIIPKLIKQPQLLDSAVWLLGSPQGIWSYCYSRQVKNEIDHDLSLMRSFGRGKPNSNFKLAGDKEWQNILNEIQVFWPYGSEPQPKYEPLAELFSQLENYKFSALFYHVCSGVVPKNVFFQLVSTGNHIPIYGITVKRHIDLYEYLWITTVTIGGVEMKAIVVFALILSGLILGGGIQKFVLSDAEKSINKIVKNFTEEYKKEVDSIKEKQVKTELISIIKNPEDYPNSWKCDIAKQLSNQEKASKLSNKLNCEANQQPINDTIILEALENFEQSNNYFNKIIEENLDKNIPNIEKENNKNNIIAEIKKALGDESDLQNCIIKKDCQEKDKIQFQKIWIEKIYLYQQTNNLDPDGILGDTTFDKLNKEIVNKLANSET